MHNTKYTITSGNSRQINKSCSWVVTIRRYRRRKESSNNTVQVSEESTNVIKTMTMIMTTNLANQPNRCVTGSQSAVH